MLLSSAQEVFDLLKLGADKRRTASTDMNERSRSAFY